MPGVEKPGLKKNATNPISRILFYAIIYLCCLPLPLYIAVINWPLTCITENCGCGTGYTWHCSAQGLPFRVLLLRNVSSYLTFSPFPNYFHFESNWVVIFCGTFSPRVFRGPCLTQGGLPYAVRTFLTIAGAIARICSGTKL